MAYNITREQNTENLLFETLNQQNKTTTTPKDHRTTEETGGMETTKAYHYNMGKKSTFTTGAFFAQQHTDTVTVEFTTIKKTETVEAFKVLKLIIRRINRESGEYENHTIRVFLPEQATLNKKTEKVFQDKAHTNKQILSIGGLR